MAAQDVPSNSSNSKSDMEAERLERRRLASRERMRKLRAADPEKFRLRQKEWYANNRERANEQARKSHRKAYCRDPEGARAKKAAAKRRRYAANPSRELERHRKWKAENPEKARLISRNSQLKRTYGISIAVRDQMLASQGGCAACGTTDPGSKLGWHIDHCHHSKKVRGILCHHCNVAAGAAKDDPARLRAIADYLERYLT